MLHALQEIRLAAHQAGDPCGIMRRLLSREAVVLSHHGLVSAHGREHIAGGLDHQLLPLGKCEHGVEILGIVGRHAAIELHGDPGLLQKPDGPGHLGKAPGVCAQSGVGLIRCAVEGNIDPGRGCLLQPGNRLLVDQGAVGIDGDDQSHFMESAENFPKIRPQEGLAAGEQQVEHAMLLRTLAQLDPLPGGPQRCNGLLLLLRQPHIAHPAGHVAAGRQFKGTVQRDSGPDGLGVEIFRVTGFYRYFHYHHSSSARADCRTSTAF